MTDTDVQPEEATQQELPLAVVQGVEVNELPKDLYIPPEALKVFLEAFQGPLDLLLYLIKRHNVDILDIPVAQITAQYMEYVDLMKDLHLELAAEYLVMAAMLTEIKSRMLLPRSEEIEEDEDDPRAELVRRLQEYERYKQAAEDIDTMPRMERDLHPTRVAPPELKVVKKDPDVDLQDVLMAFRDVMQRAKNFGHHQVEMEPLSVRERMTDVLDRLNSGGFTEFTQMFDPGEGRMGVVVTLLAILELVKDSLVDLVQAEAFAPIYLKPVEAVSAPQAQAANDDTAGPEPDTETSHAADATAEADADGEDGDTNHG